MADAEVMVEPRLRPQRKVADIPAAITSRHMIDRHRSEMNTTGIRRASLNMQKPMKPETQDLLRRRSTSFGTKETKLQKRLSVSREKRLNNKASPVTSSSSSSNKRSSLSSRTPSDTSANQAPYSITSDGRYFDPYWESIKASIAPIRLGRSNSFGNYGTLVQMDLSYLEPYEGQGLFSTSGITGNKARMTSADSLRRYNSDQDLSNINTAQTFIPRFKLRRSSSLVDIIKNVNISFNSSLFEKASKTLSTTDKKTSDGKVNSSKNTKPSNNMEVKKPTTSRQVSVKSDKASARARPVTRPGTRPSISRGGRKEPVSRKSRTNADEIEKVVEHIAIATKLPRRAVRTQKTEDDEEGEFEVVEYLK